MQIILYIAMKLACITLTLFGSALPGYVNFKNNPLLSKFRRTPPPTKLGGGMNALNRT